VKIVPSNHGHSLIVAGPHSEIVVPGKGHNLIFSHAKGATIILESPGDEVIATGPHDKIVCKHHANHELIEVAEGEKVSKSCRGHHNEIEPAAALSLSAAAAASSARHSATAHASALVIGDGTNEHPFIAPCDNPSQVDCKVSSFPARELAKLWSSEHVPAYKCPDSHPSLLTQNYAPAGTTLLHGVEVQGLGPIGVSISGALRAGIYSLGHIPPQLFLNDVGTQTGDTASSATNWTLGPASYKVILHCTSDPARGGQ
jgi:hypothetical protein